MLTFMLSIIKVKAIELPSEEQAGFRPRRSTTEQMWRVVRMTLTITGGTTTSTNGWWQSMEISTTSQT